MAANGTGKSSTPTDSVSAAYAQAFTTVQAQALSAMFGQNQFGPNMAAQTSLFAQSPAAAVPQQQISAMNAGTNPNGILPGMMQLQHNFMGQLMNDALKLSLPVGQDPHDEELLLRALYKSEVKGLTRRQALDGLHGVNNHAANLWKDYYLDHHDRLEKRLSDYRTEMASASAKRPYSSNTGSSSREVGSSSSEPIASSSRLRGPRDTQEHASYSSSRKTSDKFGRRDKKPSIPTPQYPQRGDRGSLDTSMRSPTPPDKVVPLDERRNAYTEEDRKYFIKYIRWRLPQNPDLNASEICEELARKAPHHTPHSWRSHYNTRRDEVDLIYVEARGDIDQESVGHHHGAEIHQDDESASETRSQYQLETYTVSLDESASSDSEDDRRNMSQSGGAMTAADKRVMARYMASIDEWDTLSYKEKWEPFEMMYPQRSYKAWAERYRCYDEAIDREIRKYQRRRERQQSIRKQVGRPTWAKTNSSSKSSLKRRASEVEDRPNQDLKRRNDTV